jgi:hypothetical protein
MRDDEDDEDEREFQRCQRAVSVHPSRVKSRKRDEHFVRLPWTWIRRLRGATSLVWMVACHVIYADWSNNGRPFKLPNGQLKVDGVSPKSKCRALRDLQRRGLVAVEWRSRKSPIVSANNMTRSKRG